MILFYEIEFLLELDILIHLGGLYRFRESVTCCKFSIAFIYSLIVSWAVHSRHKLLKKGGGDHKTLESFETACAIHPNI